MALCKSTSVYIPSKLKVKAEIRTQKVADIEVEVLLSLIGTFLATLFFLIEVGLWQV